MAKSGELFEGPGLKTDLSPMIDLVFLLLIFFMVAANVITYPKDPNVVIPIASDAAVPELVEGRIVINVYADGTLKTIDGSTISLEALTTLMSQSKSRDAKTRLHLRAHQDVPYRFIKEATRASSQGGVPTVIFSTYQTSR